MTTNQLDLWPTVPLPTVAYSTPLSILREQSALLEKKTNGIVTAQVVVRTDDPFTTLALMREGIMKTQSNKGFAYSFYLTAPALEQYQYLLFKVAQPLEMYPLLITDSPEDQIKVESEGEFIEALRRIFGHEKTQQVLQAMIAQSLSTPTSVGVFV
jgi:hypothetical protein